jgi:hypothetical protein
MALPYVGNRVVSLTKFRVFSTFHMKIAGALASLLMFSR